MESKFIEKTDKKYSIREDGKIIQNYATSKCGNGKKTYIYKTVTTKKKRTKNVYVGYVNKKDIEFNSRKLLIKYFGFNYCDKCNKKYIPNISPIKCDSCREESHRISNVNYNRRHKEKIKAYTQLPRVIEMRRQNARNWRKNNPEKVKARSKKSCKNQVENLTRSYIKHLLGLKKDEILSEKIYQEYKELILFKRKIAKEFDVNIASLK